MRDDYVNIVGTVLAGVLLGIIIVSGYSCVERRDNITSECLASGRAVEDCALVRCQFTSDDIYCDQAFGENK